MKTDLDFDTIYRDYFPRIQNYMIRMVGPFQAEDVAQDVFNKIHKGLPKFKGKSSLSTWIYRIATNTALDKIKTRSFQNEKNTFNDLRDQDKTDSVKETKGRLSDDKLIKEEMNDCIKEFIHRLPDDYKTVLILSEYEFKKNKEIAKILNLSIETVKIRLHRAKAKLKKELDRGCDFYFDDQNVLSCDRKQESGILPKPPE